jgi:hypothetical protein
MFEHSDRPGQVRAASARVKADEALCRALGQVRRQVRGYARFALADVERTWTESLGSLERIVFVPDAS